MEQELIILFLSLLDREPNDVEKERYSSQSLAWVENDIKETYEYRRLRENFVGEVNYDPSTYSIHVSEINEKTYDGVILSNGKIAIKTGSKPFQTALSAITTNYNFDDLGRYNNNISHGFTFTNLKFFGYDDDEIGQLTQKLNMYTATYTTEYNIDDIHVAEEFVALYQYPYCFLHTCTMTNSTDNAKEFDIFHTIEHGKNITDVKYYNNNIDDTYLFSATGIDTEKKIEIAVNNMYLFGDDKITLKGYNIIDASKAYNKLRISLSGNDTISFQIISGMMTTNDFADPNTELTRILLNIKDVNVKQEHNRQWMDIWNEADISISKKTNMEDLEKVSQHIDTFQRNIKYSLYNIFTTVREDVNVEVNTLNLSALDMNGEIFWNADMFFIPVLLLMRPKCAKVLLDFRYVQLQNAKNLAIAYGHKGSHYPYKNDILYYKDVYWNSSSPIYAFNSGLIAMNTWNYYRITLDKYWLEDKGYAILKNCAIFFKSLFDNEMKIKNVYGLNNEVQENNTLTRYLGVITLRNFVEANYEMSYKVSDDILELLNALQKDLIDPIPTMSINRDVQLPYHVILKENTDNHIYLYDVNENIIGFQFGKFLHSYLFVEENTVYTFYIDLNSFIKFYDKQYIEITDIDNGTALYTKYGFTNGSASIRGGKLGSYVGRNNGMYGHEAFRSVNESIELNNIIKLHRDHNLDETYSVLESHILLSNYYSKLLFNYTGNINNIDIIRDNYIFYFDDSGKLLNKLLKNNLEGILAQEEGLLDSKLRYVDKFVDTVNNVITNDTKGPYNNHNEHALLVFNILTSLASLRVTGSINNQRFYTESFGVKSKTGFVLPKYWNQLTVIYNSETIKITNSI